MRRTKLNNILSLVRLKVIFGLILLIGSTRLKFDV